MTHLVRTTLTKRGLASKRVGPWHLAEYGPVTLCGDTLDLATVHRLDLTRPRLLGPDVCVECVGVFDPDAVSEAQRIADATDVPVAVVERGELPYHDATERQRSLGQLTESRPAADTSDEQS